MTDKTKKTLGTMLSPSVSSHIDPIKDALGLNEKPPEIPPPEEMPDPEDKIRRRQREREAQQKYGTKGRAGTILTDQNTKLG